jgi:hypothetical protein
MRALHGLVGDEVAVGRLAPALGHELPQDGLDFDFVLVLRDPARNHHVAHVSAFRSRYLTSTPFQKAT